MVRDIKRTDTIFFAKEASFGDIIRTVSDRNYIERRKIRRRKTIITLTGQIRRVKSSISSSVLATTSRALSSSTLY